MPSTGDGRRRRGTGGRRRAVELAEDGQQWNETLSSAAVILAGVIFVVGFGFVAARGFGSEPAAAPPPDPPAPALGDLRLPTTDSQALIPLGSPSASPSVTKVASAPPPDHDFVSITRATPPSVVNLSSEGDSDWVHWGLGGTFALERDSGEFRILEGAPTAPRQQHSLSGTKFRWTGGFPVSTSDGTATGIRTCGQGNGFTLSAPAGTTPRVLKLYAGVVAGRGKLTARLTTGKSTGTTVFEQRGETLKSTVLSVAYQAPRSGQLRLTWTTDAAYGKGCSGVTLEAATLS
ncbi:hypothetical protein [Actinoplanes solisilvae]|uniref:hypothetical protein n=1 Tax=Actinoplanes solisilvae TaxID=2486853 RepID=UPI001F0C6525|nr:hypothetical protein [Actinoplanes solisilvae]